MNKVNPKVEFDVVKCFIKGKLNNYVMVVAIYEGNGMFRLHANIDGECVMETMIDYSRL